ncbi:MAG: hypothetical protein R6V58_05710 [Planctomycetota bacterium]
MPDPLDAYLSAIENALRRGDDTEHTHRPALKTLLESVKDGITATNEPKQIDCGAPDFSVSVGSAHGPLTIGYVETKDIDTPLAKAQKTEQLKRYRELPNLILTDYLEFRWYIDGKLRDTQRLGIASAAGKIIADPDGIEPTRDLLASFLAHKPQPIRKPKELAQRMARLTHMIRNIILTALHKDEASRTLLDLRAAFAEVLIPDLDKPAKAAEFADMYAQTIAYGLFAARCNHTGRPGSFKRLGAAGEIPKTNPFLRTLFNTITGPDLDDEPYAGFVDDLVQLLAYTDMDAVLEEFGHRTKRRDPVVHFYETFLAAYDRKLRKSRGVYYTPEPVVDYIVRSVDHILKEKFHLAGGLADTGQITYPKNARGELITPSGKGPRVLILDPACGTGTFLYTVVDHIRDKFKKDNDAGKWSGYVRKHLLPRLFGFELLMAPYAVAHLKLGMQLAAQDLPPLQRQKWAYDFKGNERLNVFLTNSLEEAEQKAEGLFGPLRVISQEANAASRIKRDLPIMVVMGNPPYSGHSANKGKWIKKLIDTYKRVDGAPLDEKNPKWLNDDYVKFIRFGQWRIEKTGQGILAFITNHAYLDNPTFRGMRQSLMQTFDEIRIMDLHGNSKKKERCPDGSKDENVFDIMQGVAICLMVKLPPKENRA